MTKTKRDIEDLLVWAYKDQGVDEAPNRLLGPGVALMRWHVAGDGGGGMPEPHADAFAIHAAVRRLSRLQSTMVIACAKFARRPDWLPGARPRMVAVVNGRGNPAALYDDSRHVIGHKVRRAVELGDCTILPGWWVEEIDAARAQYLGWHEALSSLVDDLAGDLEQFTPIGPSASRCPWTGHDRLSLTEAITKRY